MAVGRGKMLGRIAVGRHVCYCCNDGAFGQSRKRKRQEAREVGREIAEGIIELSEEEGRAMFDAQCQKTLGISGEEFLRRWDAGEYSADYDRCEAGIVHISMLIPFAR